MGRAKLLNKSPAWLSLAPSACPSRANHIFSFILFLTKVAYFSIFGKQARTWANEPASEVARSACEPACMSCSPHCYTHIQITSLQGIELFIIYVLWTSFEGLMRNPCFNFAFRVWTLYWRFWFRNCSNQLHHISVSSYLLWWCHGFETNFTVFS